MARIEKWLCTLFDVNLKISTVLPPEIVFMSNLIDQRIVTSWELSYDPSAHVNSNVRDYQ